MNNSRTYFIKRANAEQGPLTVAQVNRLKQRREIAADTPCRAADEETFRRLDEVLPHLKDSQSPDPVKMAEIKKEIAKDEISWLTKAAFLSPALFWAPFFVGTIASGAAIGFGGMLLFKYHKLIGVVPVFLGMLGLYLRFFGVFHR